MRHKRPCAGFRDFRMRYALAGRCENPERFPLAPESRKLDIVVREILFGRRSGVFRALFTIDGPLVRILRIRRGQHRLLSSSEIHESLEPGD